MAITSTVTHFETTTIIYKCVFDLFINQAAFRYPFYKQIGTTGLILQSIPAEIHTLMRQAIAEEILS